MSLGELLSSLRRLLALGTWLEGSTLHLAPLNVCYGESVIATLEARSAPLHDAPAEDFAFGRIDFGFDYARSVASPLPLLHGPQHARVADAPADSTRDLRLPWLADPAALEWLRTHPANPELLEAPTPLDGAVAVIDRVWAPHAAAGGAPVWQLQRGVVQAAGLPWPEHQPAWALSAPVQLARWAPLWAAGVRQVVIAPTTQPAASAAGPPDRIGRTYTLAGRPYAEPTQALSTEGPLTGASPFSGRALSTTLSLAPEAMHDLLAALDADPRGRIRLRLGGPRYAEGWLQQLTFHPLSGRTQLTLLTPA